MKSRCPSPSHFDETLEKFGHSSIFSKCGIFQRSTLSTFSMEFFRGPHLVHFR